MNSETTPPLEHMNDMLAKARAAQPQHEVAKQQSFKIELDGREFELPGFAVDSKGDLTQASMLDVMFTCLAALNHPQVNEILRKCQVTIRDNNGQIFFPRPTS